MTDITPTDLNRVRDMTQAELDNLFRASPAGDIPTGEGAGTILFDPGTEVTDVAARLVHLIAWQGKVFDPVSGELRNEVSPFELQAVVAKVYRGSSWFDQGECIVLDYSQTSLVAHWIRDEIRLIGPGLYLGIVYWDRDKILNFALQFPTAA